MNDHQLRQAIDNDEYLSVFVWCVVPRNDLELFFLFPGGYILNTDDRGDPGEHWLAIFVTSSGDVEFFDPLANRPSHYRLVLDCLYNTRAVQPMNSKLCGLYVLYYLYWRCRGLSMDSITSSLRTRDNDSIVLAHYENM
jgi:hypothetical protein